MKRLLPTLSLLIMLSVAMAQQPAQLWKEDALYLKTIIHSKYPNLFYNVTVAQFDSAVDRLISIIPAIEEYEFQAEIGKIMAMFRIGHTQAGYLFPGGHHKPGMDRSDEKLFPFVDIEFYQFSDGFYIKSAESKYEYLLGVRIIEIGDLPVKEALEKLRPFVNYENEQGFIANAPFYLRFPKILFLAGISKNKEQVHLKYEQGGQLKDVDIAVNTNNQLNFKTTGLESLPGWIEANAKSKNQVPLWRREPLRYRNMVYLPETKTCYIRHSVNLNEKEETIKTFFTKAYDFIETHDVEKLVLDVRTNGGGNNQLNKPIVTGIIQLKKINQRGKFFCIIGRRTFSACQNLVNELERYTEVIFIGEPTSENVNFYGDTKTEILPNTKVQLFCSWLWWQNMNPTDKRKATSPQLAVDMSFKDFADNIDPVMNTIQSYKLQASVDETVKEMELNHRHSEALAYGKNYRSDPMHRYDTRKIEADMNALGYSFINENKMNEAKNVFEINMTLFPDSGNTYDSYAECCLKMGLKDEARKYYEKAVQAEPDYPNAVAARRFIADYNK